MNSESTAPGEDIIEYSSFGADIDINAVHGKPARHVEIIDEGAGTKLLVIECATSGGVARTLTVYSKWARALQITKIKTATTVARLQITF